MAFKLMTLASAALLAGTAVAAPAMPPASLQARDNGCGYKILAARGTGQPAGLGSIAAITNGVLGVMTGGNVQIIPVDYPATMQNPEYMTSVSMGVSNLQQQIAGLVSACPSVKISLIGYSQGAHVVGDALAGGSQWGTKAPALSPQYVDNIKSVVLFGDPTHVNGQSFNVVNRNSNGMVPRQGDIDMAPFTNKIVSFCNYGDPVCDVTGTDGNAHTTYFAQYLAQATWWVSARLQWT